MKVTFAIPLQEILFLLLLSGPSFTVHLLFLHIVSLTRGTYAISVCVTITFLYEHTKRDSEERKGLTLLALTAFLL